MQVWDDERVETGRAGPAAVGDLLQDRLGFIESRVQSQERCIRAMYALMGRLAGRVAAMDKEQADGVKYNKR